MILKVQLAQAATTVDHRLVLIYDLPHEIFIEAPVKAFPGLLDKMGEDQRAFFDADVFAIDDKGGISINLVRKLPEQGW